jgi:hypothetical protein
MEAMCPSETSVDLQQATQRYVPEDSVLHNHHCENLKSYRSVTAWANFHIVKVKEYFV